MKGQSQDREKLRALRERLRRFETEHPATLDDVGADAADLDDETRETLQALGYLGDVDR